MFLGNSSIGVLNAFTISSPAAVASSVASISATAY
jgi:hypothetical protein